MQRKSVDEILVSLAMEMQGEVIDQMERLKRLKVLGEPRPRDNQVAR